VVFPRERPHAGRLVVALECQLQDTVELELRDVGEFGSLQPVAEHHREVGRSVGCLRYVVRFGHVDALGLPDFDEQLRAAVVVVTHPEPQQVRVGIEVDLPDARALVDREFARERREVDARQFPLSVHTLPSVLGRKALSNHLFPAGVSSLASLIAGTPDAKTWVKKAEPSLRSGSVNRARYRGARFTRASTRSRERSS
jgi:hypothetical protein